MRWGTRVVVIGLGALAVLSLSVVREARAQGAQVGKTLFPTSCSSAVQADFERAVAMLHSFWFQESGNAFAGVLQADPGCAMGHWGVAMNSLGNPFAWPPSPKALTDGRAAIERAAAAGAKTQRERDYIAALETFYRDHDKVDHRARALAYAGAMEQLAARYPDDREAAVFYALALNATALPADKTYANQLKAAAILEKVFAEQPQHPGVAHYLIHSYDYPPIADKGLNAAPPLRRDRAGRAPRAAHALAHLHAARLLARVDRLEHRVGEGGGEPLRSAARDGLPRVRASAARPGRGRRARARPDERAPEDQPRALRHRRTRWRRSPRATRSSAGAGRTPPS